MRAAIRASSRAPSAADAPAVDRTTRAAATPVSDDPGATYCAACRSYSLSINHENIWGQVWAEEVARTLLRRGRRPCGPRGWNPWPAYDESEWVRTRAWRKVTEGSAAEYVDQPAANIRARRLAAAAAARYAELAVLPLRELVRWWHQRDDEERRRQARERRSRERGGSGER